MRTRNSDSRGKGRCVALWIRRHCVGHVSFGHDRDEAGKGRKGKEREDMAEVKGEAIEEDENEIAEEVEEVEEDGTLEELTAYLDKVYGT